MDQQHAENTKRIAKNTLMLYVRMLFSMLVSLYTSRVVLQALGVEDYGIYNVVGGFVAMFSLISSSLSSAVSRFITFELGRGDLQRLRDTFSTSSLIHFALIALPSNVLPAFSAVFPLLACACFLFSEGQRAEGAAVAGGALKGKAAFYIFLLACSTFFFGWIPAALLYTSSV